MSVGGSLTQIDNGHPDKIQAGKQEVGAVFQDVEHDGIHQSCHADSNGPSSDPEPITLCTQIRRPNLCWDRERHCPLRGGI